jgi:Fe2+ or Zn2+ uptake regulation protein
MTLKQNILEQLKTRGNLNIQDLLSSCYHQEGKATVKSRKMAIYQNLSLLIQSGEVVSTHSGRTATYSLKEQPVG